MPWSSLQTEFPERTPEARAGAEQGTEAVRLGASLLQAHLSIDTVSWFLL